MHSTRIPRLCATATALSALLLTGAPVVASAGELVVVSCQADAPKYRTDAFVDRATAPEMMVKRECDPGKGEVRGVNRVRGMITRNRISAGRVRRGAYAMLTLSAPPGTHFSAFRWAGRPWRSDCRYAEQLYAERDGVTIGTIKNVRANRDCPTGRNLAQTGGYKPRTYRKQVAGATRIVQRVICVGDDERDWCSGSAANYITTYQAKATIVDDQPPSGVSIVPGTTALARGEWVGGAAQPLGYDASDNVGIQAAQARVGDHADVPQQRECARSSADGAFTTVIPCPTGPTTMSVNTKNLLEGTQSLVVEAQDSAGLWAPSAPTTVRIDNTPPGRVDVSVVGGDPWRNTPDFSVAWVNPPEGDRAPIASASYTLCNVAGGSCTRGEQSSTGIAGLSVQVPAPGEWRLSVVRADAANNTELAAASVPVTLRYDPEPPQLAFEASTAGDPTLVAVQVSDKVSGLADGAIEISRAGSDTWQTLATKREGNRLLARVDDTALAAGEYVLRATARDQANNLGATTLRLDGQPMALTLPLRVASALQVGVARERVVHRTVRRHGKRQRVRRRETVLRPAARVRFGRPARVAGRLVDRDGQGIPGAELQILARSTTSAEQLEAVVHTDGEGRFGYTATGSASRTLRVAYAGTSTTLPSQGEVQLRVPATGSLHVSRHRARNRQTITFSGRVRTLPVPGAGKLVELQVRASGRWQTFRTTRTDQAGHWALRYRFARTHRPHLYRFRAELPPEAGSPFAAGNSRSVRVLVSGD